MNTPDESIRLIRANLQTMQAIVNLQTGRSMFADVLPDPEPMLENFGDRATYQDEHEAWLQRHRDDVASQTTDGCCGECE
jgi:hypothetical protein